MRRVVYIAHPLGVGLVRNGNLLRAARWVDWAARCGVAPVADWIILASRREESMREIGLDIDRALVSRCQALWLCGDRISPGMGEELKTAREYGLDVYDFTKDGLKMGGEPPDAIYSADIIERYKVAA